MVIFRVVVCNQSDLLPLSASDMCIASAISLLMILICGMATYGAYKVNECVGGSPSPKTAPIVMKVCVFQLRAAWIIPFFCYQIFDFALNTLVAVSIVVYPNTIQDYLQQLVGTALSVTAVVFLQ